MQLLSFRFAIQVAVALVLAVPTVGEENTPPPAEERPRVEEIRIVGTKSDIARIGGSASVVEEDTLERFEYDNVDRILRQVPGVYLRGEDGYGLRPNIGIRGVNPERSAKVTLMEDGILFGPAPYSAPAAYYFPLMTRMTAVEVIKGPAAIRYGPQTIGGAINLVSRSIPDQPTIAVDGAYGQYDYGKFHGFGGGRWRNFGLLVEGVHLETTGFKDLDGGGDTGFDKNEILLKGEAEFDVGDFYLLTQLKVGYADETSNETYLGLADEDFERNPVRRYAASRLGLMEWDRQQYQLSQVVNWREDVQLRLTAYRHDFDRKWRKLNRFAPGAPSLRTIFADPTGEREVFLAILRGEQDSSTRFQTLQIGTNDREFLAQGIQLEGNWQLTTGPLDHDFHLGVRFHEDEIDRDHTEDPYDMIEGQLVRTEQERLQLLDNRGEASAWALNLQDELQWNGLVVTGGVRVEIIDTDLTERTEDSVERSTNSDTVVIPGIGAVYFIDDHWSVLGGVHRGFSPVAPGQSDAADPEDSINYELGGRFVGDRTRAEVVGFWNDYDNLLATCTQGTGCDPTEVDDQFNGGAVDVRGVEVQLSHDFATPWRFEVPTSLIYTFTDSEFKSTFSSASAALGEVEKGDELPYLPPHLLTVNIGLLAETWDVTMSMRYVDRMRDVAGQGPIPSIEKIDDAFVTDLAMGWSPVEWARLYLTITNLFDEEYMVSRRPFGARPGMPISVHGGVKLQLGGPAGVWPGSIF